MNLTQEDADLVRAIGRHFAPKVSAAGGPSPAMRLELLADRIEAEIVNEARYHFAVFVVALILSAAASTALVIGYRRLTGGGEAP